MKPCNCISLTIDAADFVDGHHVACKSPLNVSLWECPNCGERSINGDGPGWHSMPRNRRSHACPDLAEQGARMLARRVDLGESTTLLLAAVRAMRLWAADEDHTIHPDAWPFYVEAHRALGLAAAEGRRRVTTAYRTPEAPAVAPLSDNERVADAVSRVLSALRDLDGDQTRDVLLSVSALFNLGLAHVDSDGAPTLSVSDVERLLKAARGTP